MTDIQKLRLMLRRAKIKFEEVNDLKIETNEGWKKNPHASGYEIKVQGGYTCFFTIFNFAKDGHLKGMGAYE